MISWMCVPQLFPNGMISDDLGWAVGLPPLLDKANFSKVRNHPENRYAVRILLDYLVRGVFSLS